MTYLLYVRTHSNANYIGKLRLVIYSAYFYVLEAVIYERRHKMFFSVALFRVFVRLKFARIHKAGKCLEIKLVFLREYIRITEYRRRIFFAVYVVFAEACYILTYIEYPAVLALPFFYSGEFLAYPYRFHLLRAHNAAGTFCYLCAFPCGIVITDARKIAEFEICVVIFAVSYSVERDRTVYSALPRRIRNNSFRSSVFISYLYFRNEL